MGMDVFGKEPSDKRGEYFRANIWSWVPLHEAMYRTCADVLEKELLDAMGYNDGAGPDDQATCSLMADRIEEVLSEKPGGFQVWGDLRKTADGRLLGSEELKELGPEVETFTPYVATGEHVQAFTQFLRYCGGFSVC